MLSGAIGNMSTAPKEQQHITDMREKTAVQKHKDVKILALFTLKRPMTDISQSREPSVGFGKSSWKHSKSFRPFLSNQKQAWALTSTPNAIAPENMSYHVICHVMQRLLSNFGDEHRGLIVVSEMGIRHPPTWMKTVKYATNKTYATTRIQGIPGDPALNEPQGARVAENSPGFTVV